MLFALGLRCNLMREVELLQACRRVRIRGSNDFLMTSLGCFGTVADNAEAEK